MPLKDHPALAAAVLSAALIAARLLAVSRFDVSTAATILQMSGTGTVVAGTALTLLPFALVLTTCIMAVDVFIDDSLLPLQSGWAWTLFSLAAAAMMCLVAPTLVLGTTGIVILVAIVGKYSRRDGRKIGVAEIFASSRLLRIQLSAFLIVIILTPIILQRPWLPVQALTLTDGNVHVGYVLGDAQGSTVVMSDLDRTIEFIQPDQIEARSICSGPPRAGGVVRHAPQIEFKGSLLGVLLWGGNTPRYPRCPR